MGEVRRAAVISRFGGPDELHEEEIPDPAPAAGEVRISVVGAAVNPADLGTRAGKNIPADQARFPMVLGWDVAGTVHDAGAGARHRPGDRVVAVSVQPATQVGTHAERVVLPDSQVVGVPEEVDLLTAATVPLAGLTAIRALEALRLSGGQTLLINGPMGAVGRIAAQLARARGVVVLGPARTGDADIAQRLGVDHPLQRGRPLLEQVQQVLGGGVDAALDLVGDAAAREAMASVRDGGRYATTVPEWWIPGGPFTAQRGIEPFVVSVAADPDGIRWLLHALTDGEFASPIAERFALSEASAAHRRVAEGGLRGKVLITP